MGELSKVKASPNYSEVRRYVREVLTDSGIVEPPVNVLSIARDRGIDVKFVGFRDLYTDVSGFYDPRENAIYVNKGEYALRQTFTIAHELGHAVMHREWAASEKYRLLWRDAERNDKDDPFEKEANAFAANLLVPRAMLDKYMKLPVQDLSRLFAVSVPVIRNRLEHEYGI